MHFGDNPSMNTSTLETGIPPEIMADLHAVAAAVSEGRPIDPELLKRVREQAEQASQDVFRRHGLLDIGVPAIREFRDR